RRLVTLTRWPGTDYHRSRPVRIDPDEARTVERRGQPVLAPREAEVDQRRRPEPAHLHVRRQPDSDMSAFVPGAVTLGLELVPSEMGEGGIEVFLVGAGVHGEPDRRHRPGEVRFGDVVLAAHLARVHADLAGVVVDDPLEVVRRL